MKIKAFAKVNLSLDVTGKRSDGYHTLSSVMQSVSLCDDIELLSAEKGIVLTCSENSIAGTGNLAFRAAELFFESAVKYGVSGGVRIHIDKQIPLAGGLGGGSADAAAVLMGLNAIFDNALGVDELHRIALLLGADVPFCLYGGTALAEGIGEKLVRLTDFPHCFAVIAKKGTKSSTGDMYRRLDSAVKIKHPDTGLAVSGIKSGNLDAFAKGAYNCFEQVCDSDVLNEAKSVMKNNASFYCGLSGAGPSVVGLFIDETSTENAAGELRLREFEVFTCIPVYCGNKIVE